MAEVNELKVTLPALEAESKAAEEELDEILATIPNLPLAEVPEGGTRPATSSITSSGRSAGMRSSPKSISNWVKRSG